MLLTPEELQSNLERMRESVAKTQCCPPIDAQELSARRAADGMPLCHATPERRLAKVLGSGALLSPRQRGERPRNADAVLEGDDEVCFYLGSAAFPENEFAFLFSDSLTEAVRGQASATPFDSGGCVRKYPLPSGVDGLTHVKAHSMPVPECRDYLGDLLASCFEDALAYLSGRAFSCPICKMRLPDPHGMTQIDDLALVRMHEVRIRGRVGLHAPLLHAVFAPKGNVPPALAPLISSGVRLVTYDKSNGKDRTRALRKASIDYITGNLPN
jgi:hypothetical protein